MKQPSEVHHRKILLITDWSLSLVYHTRHPACIWCNRHDAPCHTCQPAATKTCSNTYQDFTGHDCQSFSSRDAV